MYSNLLKSGWVTVDADDKRIINSNDRMAEKLENLGQRVLNAENGSDFGPGEGFVGGLSAEQVDGLFEDTDGVIKAGDRQTEEQRQELLRQAEEQLALAEVQAENMIVKAKEDIEVMKRIAGEEARSQGYAEGFEKGVAEIDKLREKLKEERQTLIKEYDRRIDELEPLFMDLLIDIYERVFNVGLQEYGPIVTHLISNTIRKSDENKYFIIHVSKADYEYTSSRKEEIKSYVPSGQATVEIIEDMTLAPGDCIIETGGGIFDCGLGTQLSGLNQKLKLLSFEK